jgi:hypothetical protein
MHHCGGHLRQYSLACACRNFAKFKPFEFDAEYSSALEAELGADLATRPNISSASLLVFGQPLLEVSRIPVDELRHAILVNG